MLQFMLKSDINYLLYWINLYSSFYHVYNMSKKLYIAYASLLQQVINRLAVWTGTVL